MPFNVEFHIPFDSKISPDWASAQSHTLNWLRSFGLLRNDAEVAYFDSMRIDVLAARIYPYARGADLALMNDWISFLAVVNDQVGSLDDRRADQAKVICCELVGLIDRPGQPGRRFDTPFGRAWHDLWDRLAQDMSPMWRDRTRRHLRESFDSYIQRIGQQRRIIPTSAQYIEGRRVRNFFGAFMDFGERAGRFEVPDRALEAPLVKEMFDYACQISYLPHEVYAVEREEGRGEVDNNYLLSLEHEIGCSRKEGIVRIQTLVRRLSERFLELQAELPKLSNALHLDALERASVELYIETLRHMGRGTYDWCRQGTARYMVEGATQAIASGYEDSPTDYV